MKNRVICIVGALWELLRFSILYFVSFLMFNPGVQIEYSLYLFWILSVSLSVIVLFFFFGLEPRKYYLFLPLLIVVKGINSVAGGILFSYIGVVPLIFPELGYIQSGTFLLLLPLVGSVLAVDLFFLLYLILYRRRKEFSGEEKAFVVQPGNFPAAMVTEIKED